MGLTRWLVVCPFLSFDSPQRRRQGFVERSGFRRAPNAGFRLVAQYPRKQMPCLVCMAMDVGNPPALQLSILCRCELSLLKLAHSQLTAQSGETVIMIYIYGGIYPR